MIEDEMKQGMLIEEKYKCLRIRWETMHWQENWGVNEIRKAKVGRTVRVWCGRALKRTFVVKRCLDTNLKLSLKFSSFIRKLFSFGFVNFGFFVPHRFYLFPGLRFALYFRSEFCLGLGQPISVFLHLVKLASETSNHVRTNDAVIQTDTKKCSETRQLK